MFFAPAAIGRTELSVGLCVGPPSFEMAVMVVVFVRWCLTCTPTANLVRGRTRVTARQRKVTARQREAEVRVCDVVSERLVVQQ